MVSPTPLCWRYHSLPLSQRYDVTVQDDVATWKQFLALCEGNPPVDGFPSQRASKIRLGYFFDISLNKLFEQTRDAGDPRCHDVHVTPMQWTHTKKNTVECRYNAVQFIAILPLALQWQQQNTNSQQTPENSPWQASYGVSIVRIREKIDRVIMAPHRKSGKKGV